MQNIHSRYVTHNTGYQMNICRLLLETRSFFFFFFFEEEAGIVRFRQYFKKIILLLIKIVEIE